MKRSFNRLSLALCMVLSFSIANAQDHVHLRKSSKNSYKEIENSFYEYYQTHYSGKGSGYKQFQRWLYFEQFNVTNGESSPAKVSVWNEARNFKTSSLKASKASAVKWTELGPNNYDKNTGSWNPGNGRVNTIAFHPTNNDIIYIGAPAGGLWRTTDGGSSWTPMTDKLPISGVSAIAIDKNNPSIMYIGTGDKDNGSTRSIGMLKSVDAGATWNTTGINWTIEDYRKINELIIHPNDSKIIFAATSSGLLKSTNSGASFTQLIAGDIDDLELKPNSPATIYIVKDRSVYVSTNNGTSFTKTWGPTAKSRCLIAVSPDAASNVYLLAGEGFYKSTNNGSNFTKVSASPIAGNSSWYMWGVAVSPTNANEIHIGEFETYVSTNGGTSWVKSSVWTWNNTVGYVHADIHKLIFRGSTLFVGSDGGIFKTSDAGSSWSDLSKGLSIREFYRISTSKSNPNKIVGGAQDNGTSVYTNGTWQDWLGADGMEALISNDDEKIIYGTSQNGTWYKSNNGGANRLTITQPGAGNWVTPAVMHPTNSNIIFVGNKTVRKTTNGMSSWTSLTNFGTATAKIDALAIAESNADVLYGSKSNKIYKTTNGGSSWTEITTGISSQRISYISVNPKNPNHVAISQSGFSTGNKVFVSTNGGSSWTNISKNLPNLPARCITFDGKTSNGLYVGMEVGVYYKDDSMTEWISYFDNLPHCPINELEVSSKANKIRVATYGRGLWEAPLYGGVTVPAQTPYGGTPRTIPGTIEVEDFDNGGEGKAYHETTTGNSGNKYRSTEDVDLETCSEGGFNIGWSALGEWTEYTVNVSEAGEYKLEIRVASNNSNAKLKVKFNDSDKTGDMSVTNTSGWQTWSTISKNVTLSAGQQVMQLYVVASGCNVNWIKLTKTTTTGLPSPWVSNDIGAVDATGSATYVNNKFIVKGSGADIWGTADEFQFVNQNQAGNQTISAKVESVTNTYEWAKAGVMFRDNTNANGKFVMVVQRPDNSVCMQWRTTAGGNAAWNGTLLGGTGAPKFVKIVKNGNLYTGSYSTNGTNYTTIQTVTISMANTAKVGLAVTSHTDGTLATANFENVSLSQGTPEFMPLSGADREELTELTVIPNLENEVLEIYINSESDITKSNIGLYNMSGSLIKSAISDVRNPQIDLSGLNSGVYIVRVQVGSEIISKKFVKK